MTQPHTTPPGRAGGSRELLTLALPLIVSNAFWTVQLTVDRILLSRQNSDAVGAAMQAAVMFWTPLILLQQTAGYAITFVAQYIGAGRPERVGPAIWQSIYFSVGAGIMFLLLIPLAEPLAQISGHSPEVQRLEAIYFRCLCFAALPMLLIAAASAFFAGRGDNWPVLGINAVGTVVNAALAYAWIYGRWGFPEWGIAGAGWATVVASYTAAAVGLVWMFRRRYRYTFATLAGWRFDPRLFARMMRFGLPSGLQFSLEAMAFGIFLVLVGQMGNTELSATSIAFTVNMVALIPMVGLAQASSVLVGQRLGQERPEVAARTAVRGVAWAALYTAAFAAVLMVLPGPIVNSFRDADASRWPAVAEMVPALLRFVALYCAFESVTMMVSAALRGAGDTRFVSLATLVAVWAVMVIPTFLSRRAGQGLLVPWSFATAYVILLSLVLVVRFRQGHWRSMRVIEPAPVDLVPIPEEVAV